MKLPAAISPHLLMSGFDLLAYRGGKSIGLNDRVAFHVTITQTHCCFAVRVPIVIAGDGKSIQDGTTLKEATAHLRRNVRFKVRTIQADPQFTIAYWTSEYEEFAKIMAPYVRAHQARMTGGTDDLLKVISDILASPQAMKNPSALFPLHVFAAEQLIEQHEWNAAKKHLQVALSQSARDPLLLPFAYVYMARVAHALDDAKLEEESLGNAKDADRHLPFSTGALDSN